MGEGLGGWVTGESDLGNCGNSPGRPDEGLSCGRGQRGAEQEKLQRGRKPEPNHRRGAARPFRVTRKPKRTQVCEGSGGFCVWIYGI